MCVLPVSVVSSDLGWFNEFWLHCRLLQFWIAWPALFKDLSSHIDLESRVIRRQIKVSEYFGCCCFYGILSFMLWLLFAEATLVSCGSFSFFVSTWSEIWSFPFFSVGFFAIPFIVLLSTQLALWPQSAWCYICCRAFFIVYCFLHFACKFYLCHPSKSRVAWV